MPCFCLACTPICRCVEPQMWTPKQDDIVEYRESGFKAVADAAFCVGQVCVCVCVCVCYGN